jgi:hypothetical protein
MLDIQKLQHNASKFSVVLRTIRIHIQKMVHKATGKIALIFSVAKDLRTKILCCFKHRQKKRAGITLLFCLP